MSAQNFTVREAGALRPRLREGLRFSIQQQGGKRVCMIEDPAASRFHRIGLVEHRFVSALDGTKSVAGVLAQLAREGGAMVSEAEAMQIVRWLKDQHLLAVDSVRGAATEREMREQALRAAVTWMNPLVCRIPLFRPDGFFTRIEPLLRPLLGWAGFILWLAIVIAGAAHVGMDWQRFRADGEGLLSRDNWLWLFLAWTGLKIAHEFSHGLFCKHYGATVREAGVILVVFMPMGYVDATASIGLASRWRRMMISAAGLYMEFFLAALAAIVWARTQPGSLHTLAHHLVIIGTVVTLFFNANPLMRFDGYYLFSDLVDVPNLATRGRQWLQRAFIALLIGGRCDHSLRPRSREEWIAAVYGCAAWVWQILVLVGLLLIASVALRGGGLLLAVIGGILWFAIPLLRYLSSIAATLRSGTGSIFTMLWRTALLVSLVAAALFIPWKRSIATDGVVELADTLVLHAECPGFIIRELVQDGEVVSEGQLLVELGNDEATAELTERRLALAQQELRARLAYTRDDVATFQSQQTRTAALRKEISEREAFLATLQIRAPFAGRVTSRQLGRRKGVFISAGEEILRLGKDGEFEVKLSVKERDELAFRGKIDQTCEVRLSARETMASGLVARVEARATRTPAHPALTAVAGGPLPMRRSDEPAQGSQAETYELAEPHFSATIHLTNRADLLPGEMAHVRFRDSHPTSLWSETNKLFDQWVRRVINPTGEGGG
jgi:putative peptide zinc metalloprotease protein